MGVIALAIGGGCVATEFVANVCFHWIVANDFGYQPHFGGPNLDSLQVVLLGGFAFGIMGLFQGRARAAAITGIVLCLIGLFFSIPMSVA